jgi:tetratricopeptide (TPR) repeat protein/O-antigen ligase
VLEWIALLACVITLVAAPIAVGAVHRTTILLVEGLVALATASFAAALVARSRALRFSGAAVLPLVFLLIPVIQAIPMPLSFRATFDAGGTSLLRDNAFATISAWPLSLDPPSTRVCIGRAAAALAVFILAYHMASGRTRRHTVMYTIAVAGLLAVAIGIGHRVFGVPKLYGMFTSTARTLLVGPFVNGNHTAEFLELASFVCLACSFYKDTSLNRIGWLCAAALTAGGAIATLSRGGALALVMGSIVFGFLRYLARDPNVAGGRRRAVAWGALFLSLVGIGSAAFGAGRLIDRFRASTMTSEIRLQLWRDGLRVFQDHPLGIGRGAFDRVFPLYRTVKVPFSLRFAFLENEPLQMLVDSGWIFFLFIGVAAGLVVWLAARRWRKDNIQAALIAGLFAVLVHSLVDFGLETLGVLLPFAAVFGSVLGRARVGEVESVRGQWLGQAALAASLCGLTVGLASTAHASNDDFDSLVKQAPNVTVKRALLERAQVAHPLDYFYPLTYARLVPLKGDTGAPSPRLHALNRALRLCPGCDQVHAEVGRTLWQLGRRRQALFEWRLAIDALPALLPTAMGELFTSGAGPQEIVALATSDPKRMMNVVVFLTESTRIDDAFIALAQAEAMGAPAADVLTMRAQLQLSKTDYAAVAATLEAAKAARVIGPRLDAMEAELLVRTQGADGAERALSILDLAATRYPTDVDLQRRRVALVTTYNKWQAAARSVEGLKLALYATNGSATEAHVANARIQVRLGHVVVALGEYRIALADEPGNTALWMELGQAAKSIGHDATAREAYEQAARLSPSSPDVLRSLSDLREGQAKASAQPGGPSGPRPPTEGGR